MNVGDTKTIREDLVIGQPYGKCEFVVEMAEFLGEKVTIVDIRDSGFISKDIRIAEDNRTYTWSNKMFK